MITLTVPTLSEIDAIIKYEEGFDFGRRCGIEWGFVQRRAEMLATARRMKMSGMSNEQIASFTDLSLNEIDAL